MGDAHPTEMFSCYTYLHHSSDRAASCETPWTSESQADQGFILTLCIILIEQPPVMHHGPPDQGLIQAVIPTISIVLIEQPPVRHHGPPNQRLILIVARSVHGTVRVLRVTHVSTANMLRQCNNSSTVVPYKHSFTS